jgi:uncharacterized membrane protein
MDDRDAEADVRRHLDRWMRRSSLAISAVAVASMLAGLGEGLVSGSLHGLTRQSAIPVPALLSPAGTPFGLFAMSLGIVLLALLPGLRVMLAAGLYAGRRRVGDALVALVVFVELVVSMLTGRG